MIGILLMCGTAAVLAAGQPPDVLPAAAAGQLIRNLDAAAAHTKHAWRDTPPTNGDGTVNGYIEIPKGERRKWELDMRRNARAVDRVIPEKVGAYPVNYGFVPQTVSYDGDPFDILVLGPAIEGGRTVRGVIVGLMHMEDEKGLDSKVVVSPVDANGRPQFALTAAEQKVIGGYFARYKMWEPGKFSRVPGWGTIAEGRAFVERTHAFFQRCRVRPPQPCNAG